jgi:hypothetical protein
LKDVVSVILEIRYGWAPLIQDIQGAIEVLSKPLKPIPVLARASNKGSTEINTGYPQKPKDVAHWSESITIKGIIEVSDPNKDLANRLGLLNPLATAWDAVPFSFLFDWFCSVGPWLQSLTDFVGLTIRDGSITAKRTCSQPTFPFATIKNGDYDGVWPVVTNAASCTSKIYSRTVTSDLPRPTLGMGRGLSPGRALNAVALVLGLLDPRKGANVRGGLA